MTRDFFAKAFSNPLLQFFASGVLIFGAYLAVDEQRAETPNAIVISQAEQANMAAVFEKTWSRPPTLLARPSTHACLGRLSANSEGKYAVRVETSGREPE